jgi:hypothetical protein
MRYSRVLPGRDPWVLLVLQGHLLLVLQAAGLMKKRW